MVSLWINLLVNDKYYPPFISDAINQTKAKYYNCLSESRNAHNDITYFLNYIFDLSVKYFLTYKNIEHIEGLLLSNGVSLTNQDKNYIKQIFVSSTKTFTYNDFLSWNHIEISKQGALKILNRFTKYGILKEVPTNSGKKYFEVNHAIVLYKTK